MNAFWRPTVKYICVSVALICAVTASKGNAQEASFENLGNLIGGVDFTRGHSISRDGSTVSAVSSSNFAYYGEAAYWNRQSKLSPMGALPDHGQSNASGVSATGTWIVGLSVRDSEYTEAFRWSESTGMVGLGHLPGGNDRSIARAVSRNGRVVVGNASVEIDGRPADAPFRWTPETGMQYLTDLDGSRPTGSAWDITPDGSVIVGGMSTARGAEAFRWTEAGGYVGLVDIPGGLDVAGASAVSSDGRWLVGTGTSESRSGGVESQAVRWNEAGEVEALGFLPGDDYLARYSFAYDVSDDGQMVVGRAYTGGSSNGEQAVLWTPNEGFRTIESILLDYGIDIQAEGWVRLSLASGISGDGRTITGTGSIRGLGTQGWVVTLPIPAPTTLAPLAAMGLLGMRRRR